MYLPALSRIFPNFLSRDAFSGVISSQASLPAGFPLGIELPAMIVPVKDWGKATCGDGTACEVDADREACTFTFTLLAWAYHPG